MSKRPALLLIVILAVSSLIMVESAFAQSIPKPSVPEFTVKYVDSSYDVPPIYGIDQYTGKNVITRAGYHVQNKKIELAIKNPLFTPYEDADGNSIRLYYNIGKKGHFGNSWGYLDTGYYGIGNHYVDADLDSDYTVLTYGLVGNNGTLSLLNLDISSGDQVDFRVQAFIGYNTRVHEYWTPLGEVYHYVFTGETSDWGNTQTLTITESQTPTSSPTPTSTPYQEPQQTEQIMIIGVAITVTVFVLGLGLLIYLIKRK
jgi:hypothetical protein